jgi:hypothetical protein
LPWPPTSGYSNDTWRIGPLVLRVCWPGEVERMEREASVAANLPPDVRYPPLVGPPAGPRILRGWSHDGSTGGR